MADSVVCTIAVLGELSLALTPAGVGDIDTEAPVGRALRIQRAGPSVVMFAAASGAFAAHTLV